MSTADADAALGRAADLVAAAHRPTVFTGAGISADLGVPTFRGSGGLWHGRDPMSLATPEAFRRDPVLVWRFYHWRRGILHGIRPGAAHAAIAAAQARRRADSGDLCVITQNVDGLHGAAGTEDVLHLHGDIWLLRCTGCGAEQVDRSHPLFDDPLTAEDPDAAPDDATGPDPDLPRCDECGELLRPGVVWFGEALPAGVLEAAAREAQACDLMVVIGTSAVVHPAAGLIDLAAGAGAKVVLVNPEATAADRLADVLVPRTAAEAVPALFDPDRGTP